MKTINETRRRVIALAWEPYRMNRNAPDPRTFADARAGAWRCIKRLHAAPKPRWAQGSARRTVEFFSPIYSPIARRLLGQDPAGVLAHKAAYFTTALSRSGDPEHDQSLAE